MIRTLMQNMFRNVRSRRRAPDGAFRPALEALEERCVLSATHVTSLAPLHATAAQSTNTGSMNGSAGNMPALYDGRLVTMNFKEQPVQAEQALLQRNGSINIIYMSDAGLPGDQPFISVLDAIQTDGFNPLWQEVQITFNSGFTPRQLTSDTDVLAAAAAGEITLTTTTEIYRCSVVRTK